MRQPIECINAYLFGRTARPFVWIRRSDKVRFYGLTYANNVRLWRAIVRAGGKTSVSIGGWCWQR